MITKERQHRREGQLPTELCQAAEVIRAAEERGETSAAALWYSYDIVLNRWLASKRA